MASGVFFIACHFCKARSENSQAYYCNVQHCIILHERSERSERSKVKGIKNRHKKITPARIWMGVRVSVCLSVCLCVCLSGLKS